MDTFIIHKYPEIVAFSLTAGILTALFFYYLHWSANNFNVPIFMVNSKDPTRPQFDSIQEILRANFKKYGNGFFKLREEHGDVIILPPKYVDELKSLPESKVSLVREFEDRFLTAYILPYHYLDESTSTLIHSVKDDLTRNISKVMAELNAEIKYAFRNEVPECTDWTEVLPGQVLLRIVSIVSGRIFVGPNLNRNEDFLKCTIMFAVESFLAATALRRYPKFLWPVARYWLSEVRSVWKSMETMKILLSPVVKERLRDIRSGEGERVNDMTTWAIENSPEGQKGNIEFQAMNQLRISGAAIHTTTMQSTHIWLDLAAHPEYAEPLRQELLEVLQSEPTGVLTKTSMPKLKKLDSFLKESQRCNPIGATSFIRKVISPVTLRDGTVLPGGSRIATAAGEVAMDPELWSHPEQFDGFRFEKLRQQPGNENRFQFVTTGSNSLFFGHGPHACPGRFFASNEIKIIIAYLILNYDIKLPDGSERPKNIESSSGTRPDGTKPILMRRREKSYSFDLS